MILGTLQRCILPLAHTGHPGMVRMKCGLHQVYWWPHLDAQVEQVVHCCNRCQQSKKSTSPNPVPTQLYPKPTKPWEWLGLDIAGPFNIAPQNKKFVVALINYYLGYPELLLTSNTSATSIIRWLCRSVFSHFGYPSTIITDKRPHTVRSSACFWRRGESSINSLPYSILRKMGWLSTGT